MAEDKTPKKKAKAKKATKEKNLPGKPLKFPDLDELKKNIEDYFNWCNPHLEYVNRPVLGKDGKYAIVPVPEITQQRPYTISGLAYFLDTTRSTLLDYERLAEMDSDQLPLKLRTKDPFLLREYSYTIKKAKSRCEGYVEEQLLSGRAQIGSIFNLKNNYEGWEDKTIHENAQETENRQAIEELRQKMLARLQAVKYKGKQKPS
jgi:hypothetical protein